MNACLDVHVQPFSQKSHTPTVAKELQIGLYDPAEADLEHFWNSCSEGFLGERLYTRIRGAGRGGGRPPLCDGVGCQTRRDKIIWNQTDSLSPTSDVV